MVENLDGQIALMVRTFFKRPVSPCCGWGSAAISHGVDWTDPKKAVAIVLVSRASHTAATLFLCSVSKWKAHHSVSTIVRHYFFISRLLRDLPHHSEESFSNIRSRDMCSDIKAHARDARYLDITDCY